MLQHNTPSRRQENELDSLVGDVTRILVQLDPNAADHDTDQIKDQVVNLLTDDPELRAKFDHLLRSESAAVRQDKRFGTVAKLVVTGALTGVFLILVRQGILGYTANALLEVFRGAGGTPVTLPQSALVLQSVFVFLLGTLSVPVAGLARRARGAYSYLAGEWYYYFVTFDSQNTTTPHWQRGIQRLQVRGKKVTGSMMLSGPFLHYIVQGEIRDGKMILLDTCVEDSADYATTYYPNLGSGRGQLELGTLTGYDGLGHVISVPCVLSRHQMTASELNEVLLKSRQTMDRSDQGALQ